MIGKRVPSISPHLLKPGEYTKWENYGWYACTPNNEPANLTGHTVVEHEDGTITVSPSIRVSMRIDGKDQELWHGWLEKGVWRDA